MRHTLSNIGTMLDLGTPILKPHLIDGNQQGCFREKFRPKFYTNVNI